MKEIQIIIDDIYYCDANEKAVDFYKENFSDFCKVFFGIEITDNYFSSHIGASLLFDVSNENPKYISLKDVFPNLETADIIITNPPYKNFKAETKHYDTKELYDRDIAIYAIRQYHDTKGKYLCF